MDFFHHRRLLQDKEDGQLVYLFTPLRSCHFFIRVFVCWSPILDRNQIFGSHDTEQIFDGVKSLLTGRLCLALLCSATHTKRHVALRGHTLKWWESWQPNVQRDTAFISVDLLDGFWETWVGIERGDHPQFNKNVIIFQAQKINTNRMEYFLSTTNKIVEWTCKSCLTNN